MKVLVTGASGMLGIQVCRLAAQQLGREHVTALTHAELDITKDEMVAAALDRHRPDIVINCAGIVRGRPMDDEQYLSVNAAGPHLVEGQCSVRGIRLVQVSTDCVFDGSGPKTEMHPIAPRDIYGQSKAQGEVTAAPHLTIRTSFVGLGPRGLLAWLISRTGEVPGYTAVRWNGLTTVWAARKILAAAFSDRYGLLHLFGSDSTKHQLLSAAAEAFSLDVSVVPSNTLHQDMRLRSIYPDNDLLPAPPLMEQLTELARLRR